MSINRVLIVILVLTGFGVTSAAAGAAVDFQSPTGNIRCHGDSATPAYVDCSLAKQRWASQPPKPQSCSGAFWPQEFELAGGYLQAGRCGDAVKYCSRPCQKLEYGTSVDLGPIRCTSSKISGSAHNGGIACRYMQGTRARFHLAIEAYDVSGPTAPAAPHVAPLATTGARVPGAPSSEMTSAELLASIRSHGVKVASPAVLPRGVGVVGGAGRAPKRTTGTVGASTGTSRPATRSQKAESFGFEKDLYPMIGRIWVLIDGRWEATCSGTVVDTQLVLTAGHCVTDADNDNAYWGRIAFVPGQTWNDPNSTDPSDIRAPYQVWEASNWWAPDSYRKGDGPDWGLIQIQPHGTKDIGDVVDPWKIAAGLSLNPGDRLWLAGYPAMGYWSTVKGHEGRGLYSCASAWAGGDWKKGRTSSDIEYAANCDMNGGASGGPWLTKLSNDEWVIVGVNNWCDDDNKKDDAPGTYCTPRSSQLRTLEFDARFLSFWKNVHEQLR
jgi:hypothetical protein